MSSINLRSIKVVASKKEKEGVSSSSIYKKIAKKIQEAFAGADSVYFINENKRKGETGVIYVR